VYAGREAVDVRQLSTASYYVDRILKGAKPDDLPVEQPRKFDLVTNTKAAKEIGLDDTTQCAVASGQGD
jgi:ABC-type uncharacterized transport system substrate-binding protein